MNPSGDLFEDIVSFISWAPTVWVAYKTQWQWKEYDYKVSG